MTLVAIFAFQPENITFELAGATAIALHGPRSGAAPPTVVGVLVEVPGMLSVCRVCVSTRGWLEAGAQVSAERGTAVEAVAVSREG